MRVCSNCGSENATDVRFCARCGADLLSAAPPPLPPNFGPQTQSYGAQGQNYAGVPTRPPNHLVLAIITTVLCCLPGGVVAIIYAAQVDSKWSSGDYAGALAASSSAKNWSIISMIVSGVLGLAYFLVMLIAAAAGGL